MKNCCSNSCAMPLFIMHFSPSMNGVSYICLLHSHLDTAGVEAVNDNRNTMWQGKEEVTQGNWTEFLSPSNEVFVPDDRAWAGAENVVVEVEDSNDIAAGLVESCLTCLYKTCLYYKYIYFTYYEILMHP